MDEPITLQGAARYFQGALARLGEGEFDATLTVRHQPPHSDEVTASVSGAQVGWVDPEERLLTRIRELSAEGDVHARLAVWTIRVFPGPIEEYQCGLLIPRLAQLKMWLSTPEDQRDALELRPPLEFLLHDNKGHQAALGELKRSGAITAEVETFVAAAGKYAGERGLLFTVNGAQVGVRTAAKTEAAMLEAYDNGVRTCKIRVEGAPGNWGARATMQRHPSPARASTTAPRSNDTPGAARYLLTARFPDGSSYIHDSPRPYTYAVAVEPRSSEALLRYWDKQVHYFTEIARSSEARGDEKGAAAALSSVTHARQAAEEVLAGQRHDKWSVLRWAGRLDLAERTSPEDRLWRDELGHRLVVVPVEAAPVAAPE